MISPVSHGIVAFESITRSAGPDIAPSSDPKIGWGETTHLDAHALGPRLQLLLCRLD